MCKMLLGAKILVEIDGQEQLCEIKENRGHFPFCARSIATDAIFVFLHKNEMEVLSKKGTLDINVGTKIVMNLIE